MPIHGIVNTARSLAYYERLQEVTANNVANANTDAFKADRLTAHRVDGSDVAVPVEATDLGQGAVRETGRPLDLALDGPGFLVAGTERGERLVRGGSLRLDPAGRITDPHGAPLLGENGEPIYVTGANLEIRSDGEVLVDGSPAGRLRRVAQPPAASLRREGYGRFFSTTPTLPAAEGVLRLRQHSIEDANADPILAIVDLVNVQRSYGANIDALKCMDGVLGTVVNQVGRVE